MNVALWIVQGLLALVFGGSGVVKATRDRKRLFDDGITWVEDFPAWGREDDRRPGGIGRCRADPSCAHGHRTGPDAHGRGRHRVLMAGAGVVHFRRGEIAFLGVIAVLFRAAVFVAWGRFGPYAF